MQELGSRLYMRFIKKLLYNGPMKDILGIFVISRVLILFIGYLSNLVIIKGEHFNSPRSLLDLFFSWDSGWYLDIVKNGYFYIPGKESSVAFFPLYPIL